MKGLSVAYCILLIARKKKGICDKNNHINNNNILISLIMKILGEKEV